MQLRLLFLLLLWAGAGHALGGLVCDQPILELRSLPADRKVDGTFVFRNTGATPVTITRVRTGCGCTTTRMDKMRLGPGESAEMVATFKYWFEKGRLRKLLTVFSDDPQRPVLELEMRVLVEDAVEVSPGLVFWKVGEPPAPKLGQVKIDPRLPATVRAVECDDPAFEVRLEPGGSESEFAVRVMPKGTGEKAGGTIRLITVPASGNAETHKVYARIK